jgi:hypothetical protein
VVLLAFEGCPQLLALYVVGETPSLNAQLMPVVLPDISLMGSSSVGGSSSSSSSSSSPVSCLADFVWDPSGHRLGVLLKAPHAAAGCLAIFAVSTDPVVHARMLGVARPPLAPEASDPVCVLDAGSAASSQPASDGGAQASGAAFMSGSSSSLCSHQTFAKGALFTLRTGPHTLFNLPLIFR